MRLFYCVIFVFAFVVNSQGLDIKIKENIKQAAAAEVSFHEIVHNISNVNNILKSLIKNYKQLKKLYDSEESKESMQANDSIEYVSQNPNAEHKRNRNDDRSEEYTNKSDSRYATRMYFSEDKSTEISSGDLNANSDNEDKTTDSETTKEKSNKKLKKPKKKKKINENHEQDTTGENDKEENDTQEKDGLEISLAVNTKVGKDGSNNEKNTTDRFSDEVRIVKRTDLKHKRHHYTLRRMPVESALIIIANSSGIKDDHQKDNTGFINSEQFKTDVLRSTYSDACLKLVIRKCYQASKKAYKEICRQYKCNKKFKSTFEKHIRGGCIEFFGGGDNECDKETRKCSHKGDEEFTNAGNYVAACFTHESSNANYKSNKGKQQKLRADKETKSKKNTGEQNEFNVDDEEKLTTRNETITPSIEDSNTNILRDNLEKACQKISNGKCKKSCNFAATEACKAQKCNTDKRKDFKKECKEQCQKAFNAKRSESESSSSSSSDGSSSSKSDSD